METIGIANDTVAPQGLCHIVATIRLTVVRVFQQNADNLYLESLFEFLVADVFTQVGVDLDDALSHTDVRGTPLCCSPQPDGCRRLKKELPR